ncbi:phosphoinositide phosphatase SAC2 isoform X2 [Arachis duranensis]|uniref:Phosphoinositide phosphatase SAC2 isoform X2 n=1 Tax=Arachis duranensis TaxID=130453 RepID=A0A9C6TAC7_ARADU|nr:phosphoinositide phosphatase SAC2 isoform X2 [Arachis duranensis]
MVATYEEARDYMAQVQEAFQEIFSEKRGQWKAATQSQEYIRSFQRYYSNTYLDGNKQKAINLFLGHFQPQQGKPALWEIDSDQYCTVGKHGPSSVNSNVRLFLKCIVELSI